tara:strand:- start:1476 stop:3509 length:2034 start_codon:yes stop_codon:yes gene_type:complete
MAKKSKKDKKTDKKKVELRRSARLKAKKSKSIPAKAGAKARVDSRGKVEVILPVDRSRGKYKPRQSKEDQIAERIKKLREEKNQNSLQFAREQFANETLGANTRRSGSINRSNVAEPIGGFTGGTTDKNNLSKVQQELKEIKEELKKQKAEKQKEPKTARPPTAEIETQTIEKPKPKPVEETKSRPLTGQTIRREQRRSIVADTFSNVVVPAAAVVSGGVALGLRAVGNEAQRQRDEKRKQLIKETEAKAIADTDRIVENLKKDREKKFKERELQKRKQEEAREILEEKRKKEIAKKVREQINPLEKQRKEKDINSLIDDLMGGKKESNVELKIEEVEKVPEPEPVVEEEDSDDEFQSAEEFDYPEEEEPIKDRSKLVKNIKPIVDKAKEDSLLTPEKKSRRQSFIQEAEKEEETEAKKKLREEAEKLRELQIAGDQKVARELLIETARNRDRKRKEQIEKQNKIDKLIQKEIEDRRRAERNRRRRVAEQVLDQTIQKSIDDRNKDLSKKVVGSAIDKAEKREEAEEVSGDIITGLIGRAVNESSIQNTPINSGRGRKQNDAGYFEKGFKREEIAEFRDLQERIKRNRKGLMFFNLNGNRYDYKNNKDLEKFIREDIRTLQERGMNQLEIDQATAILNILVADIRQEKKFNLSVRTRSGSRQLVQDKRGRPKKDKED